MVKKVRVVIVCGGRSGEHEVSLRSANSVLRALDPDKYEVDVIGITKQGTWLIGGDPLRLLSEAAEAEARALHTGAAMSTALDSLTVRSTGLIPVAQTQGSARFPRPDVVFPILHGPFGEDGAIQGLLEMAGIPYVGAGVLASAVGMDKGMQKDLFRQCGLPVVRDIVFLRRDWERTPDDVVRVVEKTLPYPVFVKPANMGSSVGISKVRDREQLQAALNLAAAYDRRLLVEEAVLQPREIEVSVLGNDDPITSVCGEIIPKREFYDYVSKYSDDSTELIVPARLPQAVATRLRDMAAQAFVALDCAGMARVDFLATPDLKNIYINEANTIPGFTSVSMFARLFEATGVPYSELLDRLIAFALERHADRSRVKTSWA